MAAVEKVPGFAIGNPILVRDFGSTISLASILFKPLGENLKTIKMHKVSENKNECSKNLIDTNNQRDSQSVQEIFEKRIQCEWLTTKEAAQFLGVSENALRIMVYRDESLSPWSRKTVLKMVRRIFEMAVEEGIIDRNPCAGIQVKVPEVEQKVLTNTEVAIFLREAKAVNHRFYPVWALALMTGMRSGELFALKWTDLDLEARTISVTKQWTNKNGISPTKTQRSRVVPISDELVRFLSDLRFRRGADSEFVLPRLEEWEHGEQARVTREFCSGIGVTEVKFHDLRATFITNLLARGESLARVMAVVGHSQIKTTNGYLRKAGVDVQGATEKLGYTLPTDAAESKVLSIVRNNA